MSVFISTSSDIIDVLLYEFSDRAGLKMDSRPMDN